MKTKLLLFLAVALAASLRAQVQVLPPDFVLFGKTSGEYLAEWLQHTLPLSTNGDYLLPQAVPSETDPVYFLQRPFFGTPPPGLQTYFIPDDVYVCFPIDMFLADNVDSCPPCYTIDELRNGLKRVVDAIVEVHAIVNGVALTNLLAYGTESPVFSLFLPSSDNFYTVALGHPLEGLDDPVIASGYFLMFKPLPAGLYDFRTGASNGPPNSFSFERHFQIYSLTMPQFLAHETDQLTEIVTSSSLELRRQQPLLATLNAASASFVSHNFPTAINQLRAFQNKARAQIAPDDPDVAAQLTLGAQQIIDRATKELK